MIHAPTAPAFILRGHTLAFKHDPFKVEPAAALDYTADGAVVVEGGLISHVGPAHEVLARHPGLPVERFKDDLIMAGFVDAHVHYPQTEVIASYGAQLLDWLNTYTFPAELKFADPVYAAQAAEIFLDEILRNGTTSASVYCTVHPQSVDALFEAAFKRGLRLAAGKVMMDRNAPQGLTDTAADGYAQSQALITRWHGRQRLTYVVSPRFAPTSSPEQLTLAGVLWAENPTTLMQTHTSENKAEIAWVRELYPDAKDYIGVYEDFGLLGPGANLGHAIHLSKREIKALRSSGAGISHCPTSNTFIGSGLFDMQGLRDCDHPIEVGLGSDVGGGSSFSMFATMKAAYEIAQLRGVSLHPAKAYYLATVGSARVLRTHDKVGNLRAGLEADLIVMDLKSTPLIAHRMAQARDISDILFAQMILGDDRAIRHTMSGGLWAHRRDG